MSYITKLALKLDRSPEYKERKQPRTWSGVVISLFCLAAIVTLFVYNVHLWFTESEIQFKQTDSVGKIYQARFMCVSTGGCNITYQYTAEGLCGELASTPGFNVSENEEFVLQVCRARDAKEGTRVTTMFERNRMWVELNRLWAVELYQAGNFVPVGKIVTNDVVVVNLRSRAMLDRTKPREGDFWITSTRVISNVWTGQPTAVPLFDTHCFQTAVPFGYICGSVQFTVSDLFDVEDKHLSKEFQPNVMAPTFALITASSILLGFYSWMRYNNYNVCCSDSQVHSEQDTYEDDSTSGIDMV